MAMKLFPENILLLNVECSEGFLNLCKIDRMVNDNSSSCNLKFFKNEKRSFAIFKQAYQLENEAMALKFLLHTTLLLDTSCFEGLLNWKID